MININDEIVIILASLDIINSIVNKSFITLIKVSNDERQLQFPTDAHMKYFSIILVEFLSKPDVKFGNKDLTFLGALNVISEEPNFTSKDEASDLRVATTKFLSWLNEEVVHHELWFPTLGKSVDLKIRRIEYLKICGNITKHSFLRLSYNASQIKDIFHNSNVEITTNQAIHLLDEFYEWFYDHFFSYHAGTIAEFLNDIRLGIHTYLKSEFKKSYYNKPGDDELMYHYRIPESITDDFYKENYWELMNRMRSEPYMEYFKSYSLLKQRY